MDNLRAFVESCQEIGSEEPPDRDHLADEQKADDSLQSAWKEAEDRENDEIDVRGGLLYKIESNMATRFPEAKPLRRVDAESVVEAMIKFFSFVGFPQELLTDRGTNFTSCLMQEVSK